MSQARFQVRLVRQGRICDGGVSQVRDIVAFNRVRTSDRTPESGCLVQF